MFRSEKQWTVNRKAREVGALLSQVSEASVQSQDIYTLSPISMDLGTPQRWKARSSSTCTPTRCRFGLDDGGTAALLGDH